MQKYEVTDAGHLKDIGGKRRRAGETITLTKAQAQFEELRETIKPVESEDKPKPKAGK